MHSSMHIPPRSNSGPMFALPSPRFTMRNETCCMFSRSAAQEKEVALNWSQRAPTFTPSLFLSLSPLLSFLFLPPSLLLVVRRLTCKQNKSSFVRAELRSRGNVQRTVPMKVLRYRPRLLRKSCNTETRCPVLPYSPAEAGMVLAWLTF